MYRSGDGIDLPASGVACEGRVIALAQARRGDCGVVVGVGAGRVSHAQAKSNRRGVTDLELEQRLLEIGFVEGARVQVLHEGPFGRDPVAVRVDDTRIALRRREAADVLIELEPRRAHR